MHSLMPSAICDTIETKVNVINLMKTGLERGFEGAEGLANVRMPFLETPGRGAYERGRGKGKKRKGRLHEY